METLFLNMLLIGPFWSIVLVVISVLLGGFVASRVLTVRASFRRVTFFWVCAVAFLVFSVLHIGSAFLGQAASAGLFIPLCLFLGLTFPLQGAFAYYVSAARSNHIQGDTSLAWLGFVPIANLWLLFKPGRQDETRIFLEHGVRDGFILAAAVVPIWLGNVIMDDLNNAYAQESTLSAFEKAAPTAEDAAYYKALDYNRLGKPDLYRGLRLRNAEADKATLHLHYEVPSHMAANFAPESMREQALQRCSSQRNQKFLNDGGRFVIRFETPKGASLGELSLTAQTCGS